MINKYTVVLGGRDTGKSRNIEYSSFLNDGALVVVAGREGFDVVVGGEGRALDVVGGGGV